MHLFVFFTFVYGSLNVLLISVDDLRPQLSKHYGLNDMHTPNLERLQDEGVSFTRAFAQYSLDNPSMVSILTGTRPETTRVYNNDDYFRSNRYAFFLTKKKSIFISIMSHHGGKWVFRYKKVASCIHWTIFRL